MYRGVPWAGFTVFCTMHLFRCIDGWVKEFKLSAVRFSRKNVRVGGVLDVLCYNGIYSN